jgi:hypothetical protein
MLLTLSGPLITLFGVMLGAVGTLLMCRAHHPFSTTRLVGHLFQIVWLYATGRMAEARQSLQDATLFGEVNRENRYRTLEGVYLLVFSFLIQIVGAVFIVVDTIVHSHS